MANGVGGINQQVDPQQLLQQAGNGGTLPDDIRQQLQQLAGGGDQFAQLAQQILDALGADGADDADDADGADGADGADDADGADGADDEGDTDDAGGCGGGGGHAGDAGHAGGAGHAGDKGDAGNAGYANNKPSGSSSAPATTASSAPGLKTDPNDPSHKLSKSAPAKYQQEPLKNEIENASKETGVPADRIAATMWAESRNKPESSNNPDGKNTDVGWMQINTETYGDVQKSQNSPNLNLNNEADNIRAGAWELRDKYLANGSNWAKAHAAYRGVEDGQDNKYASAVEQYYQDILSGKTPPDSDGF